MIVHAEKNVGGNAQPCTSPRTYKYSLTIAQEVREQDTLLIILEWTASFADKKPKPKTVSTKKLKKNYKKLTENSKTERSCAFKRPSCHLL